jgi:hypothetical protein
VNKMTARTGRTVAALIAGVALAGCHFAVVPPKPAAHPSVQGAPPNAPVQRLADAPALLVQCAADRIGLRPAGQDWLKDGKVSITSTDAADFNTWWRAHETPGPYPESFTIDGHLTHYLSFGATWVRQGGQWVPQHIGHSDPLAQQQSLYGWAAWAAQNDRLPPAVCGTSLSARQLQAQVFGSSGAADPWAT